MNNDIVAQTRELARRIKALDKNEEEVFNTIIDYLDTLPDDFFEKNSLEKLNDHFGGHDNMVVTEKVRLALAAQQRCEKTLDEMAEIYPTLPEED